MIMKYGVVCTSKINFRLLIALCEIVRLLIGWFFVWTRNFCEWHTRGIGNRRENRKPAPPRKGGNGGKMAVEFVMVGSCCAWNGSRRGTSDRGFNRQRRDFICCHGATVFRGPHPPSDKCVPEISHSGPAFSSDPVFILAHLFPFAKLIRTPLLVIHESAASTSPEIMPSRKNLRDRILSGDELSLFALSSESPHARLLPPVSNSPPSSSLSPEPLCCHDSRTTTYRSVESESPRIPDARRNRIDILLPR